MKTLLSVTVIMFAANAFAIEDCSTAAKDAANAVVKLNAKRLGIKESAIAVEKTAQTQTGQAFNVTTQSGADNTFVWKIETSNNCQVGSVIYQGGE